MKARTEHLGGVLLLLMCPLPGCSSLPDVVQMWFRSVSHPVELGNGRAVMFHLSNIIKLWTSEHYQTLSNSEPGPATISWRSLCDSYPGTRWGSAEALLASLWFMWNNDICQFPASYTRISSNIRKVPITTSMLSNNVRNRMPARVLHVNKIQIDDLWCDASNLLSIFISPTKNISIECNKSIFKHFNFPWT